VIGPFPLVDAAGRRLTTISVPVDDGARLLCINFDRTAVDGALAVLASLATAQLEPAAGPAAGDWPARISAAITTWCAARNLTPRHLTTDARRQVVRHLDAEGLFETRNAAEHVAAALGVSRATIYNLRQRATPPPCRTTPSRR
jgi:predicted transcriptional regulator YheO